MMTHHQVLNPQSLASELVNIVKEVKKLQKSHNFH